MSDVTWKMYACIVKIAAGDNVLPVFDIVSL